MAKLKVAWTKKSVPQLEGIVTGKRLTADLSRIKIGDKWESDILPRLEADGLGQAALRDGAPVFTFKGATKPTIIFTANDDSIEVSSFEQEELSTINATDSDKEADTDDGNTESVQ